MKLKIKELYANPFKKKINEGKLSKTQIEEISGNLGELGFMGAVPVVNIKGKYHLVNSHHRVEALKRKFGKDYEVQVTIHNYNEDQLMRGMVIENLSQRGVDFHEEKENIKAVEGYLNSNKEILTTIRATRTVKDKHMEKKYQNIATARDVKEWLKLSDKKWGEDTILNIMNVYNRLNPELIDRVQYTSGKKTDKDSLGFEEAKILARIEDPKEQKQIAKLLKDTGLDYKNQSKLVTQYKEAPEEIKEKVKKGQINLRDITAVKLSSKKELNMKTEIEELKERFTSLNNKLILFKSDQYSDKLSNSQKDVILSELRFHIKHYVYPVVKKLDGLKTIKELN